MLPKLYESCCWLHFYKNENSFVLHTRRRRGVGMSISISMTDPKALFYSAESESRLIWRCCNTQPTVKSRMSWNIKVVVVSFNVRSTLSCSRLLVFPHVESLFDSPKCINWPIKDAQWSRSLSSSSGDDVTPSSPPHTMGGRHKRGQ